MSDTLEALKNFPKSHDYLIAIDSDGCAFDSMEIKHKECFIPNIIKYWDLQPVSKYARAAAEFVNLYSKWRGINRWPALTMVFDLLEERPEVRRRGVSMPQVQPLRDWIARETKLSNATLKELIAKSPDAVLERGLAWSEAVNAAIHDLVKGVPPFPFVRESLEEIGEWADVLVCSATPCSALQREWEEHDIARYVKVIAGQEQGSKKEHIAMASAGRYDRDKVLMIGDAPGDRKAADGNGAHFFPINPGDEESSWERFYKEAAPKFRDGAYTAEYERRLIDAFEALLPEKPPWKS
jgi:phosphoglycolate phosphatase-like HAD superfamily hydrolase